MKNYKLELKLSITEIDKDSWNNMNHSKNPFYQWQWLANLELSKSVERLTKLPSTRKNIQPQCDSVRSY